MTKERPTIKHVADLAGVSVSTASVAVNNATGRVSTRTRRKVCAIAESIGYQPNPTARQLLSGRSGVIGLALPSLSDSAPLSPDAYIAPTVILGLWAGLGESGLALQLLRMADGAALDAAHMDGLVVLGPFREGEPELRAPSTTPTVYLGVHNWAGESLIVDADNTRVGALAAETILQKRPRRVAVATIEKDYVSLQERLQGALGALERGGAEISDDAIISFGVAGPEDRLVATHDVLTRMPPETDAVLVLASHVLLPIISWAQTSGKTIGSDLRIVSVQGAEVALTSHLPVDIIELPFFEMGREAARMVIAAMSGDATPNQRRLLQPRLIQHPGRMGDERPEADLAGCGSGATEHH